MGQAQSFTDHFVYHTAVGDGGAGCSPIYRAASHPTELVEGFLDRSYQSTWDLFEATVSRMPNRKFLGRRFRDERDKTNTFGEYEWMTYAEAKQIALAFGSVMTDLMVDRPKTEGMQILGIYAKNCVEWFLAEQACNAYDLTLCPLYDTLGDEAMEFIFKQTAMHTSLVAFENLDTLVRVLEDEKSGSSTTMKPGIALRHIVLVNPCTPNNTAYVVNLHRASIEKAKALGLEVDLWHDVVSRCTRPKPPSPGKLDSINTLCYTSGTTGMPKAVLLPHRMIMAVVIGSMRGPISTSGFFEVGAADFVISYLPLAHVFERCVCNIILSKGGAIGVYSGDLAKLLDDVKVLRPTVFVSVPRLFSRINDRVSMNLVDKAAPIQSLFNVGLSSKVNKRKSESVCQHRVWDSVVFSKIRHMMGGRLRGMISGGAPLDPIVAQKMEAFFACPLMQGYGLSETFGPCFLMHPEDPTAGNIGGVWPSVEFKLQSVPELNYFVSNPNSPPTEPIRYGSSPMNTPTARSPTTQLRLGQEGWLSCGELLLRGPGVCPGYFANAEETKQAFDEDGWFHTGDIACLDPKTLAVKIIDRKKNIFKLAQGEYVAPEKIESVYAQALSVAQIFIHGESMQPNLVAIVYPDVEGCKSFLKNSRSTNAAQTTVELAQLCSNPDFVQYIKKDMEVIAKKMGLAGFEKAKEITLTHEPFTVENNLLTPTSKLRRAECKKRYQNDIAKMYNM